MSNVAMLVIKTITWRIRKIWVDRFQSIWQQPRKTSSKTIYHERMKATTAGTTFINRFSSHLGWEETWSTMSNINKVTCLSQLRPTTASSKTSSSTKAKIKHAPILAMLGTLPQPPTCLQLRNKKQARNQQINLQSSNSLYRVNLV